MRSCENSSASSANCRPERSVSALGAKPAPATGACRLRWRPSRLLCAGLIVLAALAAFSVLASELPAAAAWPLAILTLGRGLWSARREAVRPARSLTISGGRATLDDIPVSDLRLHWRGWLARLDAVGPDGRRLRLSWWPDTLDAGGRRELRLAVAVLEPARGPSSMAP
ncbi:hypothetical protein [Pseudomonas sp. CGJS7]|uniref:hypothetical protein n=1 Tax=Pseudomonas sp. CGJS7 TaxID=3109348 RepID=UPI00300952BA